MLLSIDNTFSFQFSKESLVRLLGDVGFNIILECHGPREPFKPANRVTLIARKADLVSIATYPWINGTSEDEIKEALARERSQSRPADGKKQVSRGGWIDRLFGHLGYEIRRIKS